MKNTLIALSIIMSMIYLPFTFYMSYLLYKHVQATELMWFLWFMNIPVAILTTLVSVLMREASKK